LTRFTRKTDRTIDSIDLGGGLGIPFQDDQLFPTIDEYAYGIEATPAELVSLFG
jgi:diaminopimelate decarboxylase